MEAKNLQSKIGVKFRNPDLLEIALTHRSYLNENRSTHLEHNERLEFLGDAVLELVVTEHLYRNYAEPEGVLTNWRSALVKTESLSAAATQLELDQHIRLSRGEARGSDRAKRQIMANAFEAVLGAIYLDQGYDAAARFVTQNILGSLKGIIKSGAWLDAKTKLQELIQERENLTPTYDVLEESGPDHDKQFTVGVFVGDELRGKGMGTSKQAAQQAAAEQALAKVKL
ncbi:ribonuclease III [Candidatus Microgenomates bacterium]|nr:ribonuclease III [Candidatus Microgenomates bacterium]